ncbi:MAG: DNA repair protein RecN [Anaerovoracaceae bacterium]|nr:DNA repair protein RecN [Anaerovoracaceae bacterium]
MIHHISIKNFAIIEQTEIDFAEGLNIITGETGSGKSIVIEAISLALGSRADSSYVRTGTDKAVIQLSGELDGEEILLTREISAAGKNLCRYNDEIVTLNRLNQIARRLADIHGQYDNQSLLNPDYHIVLVDVYRHDITDVLKKAVQEAYSQYAEIRSQLGSLLTAEKENRRKLNFLRFEADEIEKASLRPDEDQELEERISLLQNSEKIFENIEKSYGVLYDSSPSVMDGLRGAMRSVEEIASFSSDIGAVSQEFSDVYYRLEDICRSLRDIKDRLTFNPEELDDAISRLELINSMKKKYGDSIEEVLQYFDSISSQIAVIENFETNKASLEQELKTAAAALRRACAELTEARKESAAQLSDCIQRELVDLNFSDAQLEIRILPLEKPTENGMDQVEILITTNRGEPLKPLTRVASGGEMSRIMLAFKNVISSYDNIPTLIFDEIDTGISGITASIVGRKLKEISRSRQILCITHLPQIAACGDHNYRIHKESDDTSTYTRVEALNPEETVCEIARLLGGATITETTLENARELIAGNSL